MNVYFITPNNCKFILLHFYFENMLRDSDDYVVKYKKTSPPQLLPRCEGVVSCKNYFNSFVNARSMTSEAFVFIY